VENIALDQNRGEARNQAGADAAKPFVGLAFKLEDGRYGQPYFIAGVPGQVSKGDFIVNCSAGERKGEGPALVRMHADEREDIPGRKPATSWPFSGWSAPRATPSPTACQLHDDVHACARRGSSRWRWSPRTRRRRPISQRRSKPLHQGDPTFRVSRDEESGQTIISGMGEACTWTSIERMKTRVQLRGDSRFGPRSSTADHYHAWRVQHTHRSKRRFGSTARCGLHRALASDHERLRVRDEIVGARSRVSSFRPATRASRGHEAGTPDRLPYRPVCLSHHDRPVAPGGLV